MGEGIGAKRTFGLAAIWRRLDAIRKSLRAKERMEMPVFTVLTAVSVVVILGSTLSVVNIALGKVVQFYELTLMFEDLGDGVCARFTHDAQGLQHVVCGFGHNIELGASKAGKIIGHQPVRL
jgi:hypothetical protein